jgi:DNA-binding NarL/FixJ family response regulator
MNKIKIIVVDDHVLLRQGVVPIINADSRFEVISEASNGQELIDQLENGIVPDLILLGYRMPVMDGMEATRIIKREYPLVKVLCWSMSDPNSFIEQFRQVGGDGFIPKDTDQQELLMVITMVAEGKKYFNS